MGADAEEVLGQLLGDGGCSAGRTVEHVVFQCCTEGLIVDAVMAVETFVLGVDQCVPEGLVYVFVADGHSVLAEEFSDEFAVGTVYF